MLKMPAIWLKVKIPGAAAMDSTEDIGMSRKTIIAVKNPRLVFMPGLLPFLPRLSFISLV